MIPRTEWRGFPCTWSTTSRPCGDGTSEGARSPASGSRPWLEATSVPGRKFPLGKVLRRCAATGAGIIANSPVGFQIVSGVAINAALHRTVLLNLESDELIPWANEILRHCLFDELPPALLELGLPMLPAGVLRD